MRPISKEEIAKIKEQFRKNIDQIKDKESFEAIRIQFLGRKSQLNMILKGLKDLSIEKKKELGAFANQTRIEIEEVLNKKNKELESKQNQRQEWIDVTAPGKKSEIGHHNILFQTQRDIEGIFTSMGFEIADGPEIEDEWHNFTALNMPADHPARDMQDTFWLEQGVGSKIKNLSAGSKGKKPDDSGLKLLPRTHTSNVQIRYMETHKPPIRIIVPGRVFRNEATDARHEHTFFQFEALVVDKDISVANFKHIAKVFFSQFLQSDVDVRLRPSYFPFTEPSFEFDITCVCGGKGCGACKGSGWLEIGGAGMVNQRVFEASGYKRRTNTRDLPGDSASTVWP